MDQLNFSLYLWDQQLYTQCFLTIFKQNKKFHMWDFSSCGSTKISLWWMRLLNLWLSLCRWKWSYIVNLALWLYPGNSNWSALLEAFAAKEISPFSDLSVLSFLQKQIPVHLSSAWRHLFYQWMRHIFKGEKARNENQPFCLGEVQKEKVEDL